MPRPIEPGTPWTPPDGLDEDAAAAFLPHRDERGRFFNPWPGARPVARPADLLKWQVGSRASPYAERKRTSRYEPQLVRGAAKAFEAARGALKVMWFGHASYLVEVAGVRIAIDPVFGHAGALVRRRAPCPISPNDIARLDAVLLTHGHYDHCDVASLRALARRHPNLPFVTPIGLAGALPRAARKRLEVDWWDTLKIGDARLTFTPSQHWHKRGAFDTNAALWGGWFIEGAGASFYHPGDSGYFSGFAAIRATLGAPDLLALPVGAFAPRWFMSPQHMDPHDALRMWETMGAPRATPMHWGTFDLSDEPLDQGLTEIAELFTQQKPPGELLTTYHGSTFTV